jgi:hypothetical protein
MQLSNAASAITLQKSDNFVYYWRVDESIPRDVTHVIVHSSVRAIMDYAFYCRMQLVIVILNKELEKIGWEAFKQCTSLECIKIPNAVNAIKEGAFDSCSQLRIVTLGHGQREIEVKAFSRCTSLVCIKIPTRR